MYSSRSRLRRSLPWEPLHEIQTVKCDRTLDRLSESIPITYVAARNTIFLSFGFA
ncbi:MULTISPECIES: hypothetical protein [unclassified Microcoleus]|uniref:hypothetical protein n=1 Tax=unclassified Microcoleus TaxID=2642155 RepID=UPI002FCF4C5A